jgi:hypothetical protein
MAAKVTFKGINAGVIYANALAVSIGQQKAHYVQGVLSALGANPIFEIRVGTSIVYRTVVPTAIPVAAAGISMSGALTEPPSLNSVATLSGDTTTMVLRHATNSSTEISVPLKFGGDPALFLTASKNLNGTDFVRLLNVLLKPPAGLDVPIGGGGGGGESGDDWLRIALTDMRKDPATGSFSYSNSYALNEARTFRREERSPSSQYTRAQLSMGRYPNPAAFDDRNPDYQTDLTWVTGQQLTDARAIPLWDRIMWWADVFLSDDYQTTASKHAPGYVGNSRVLFWDTQCWLKKGGVWSRMFHINPSGGEAWRPSFTGSNNPSMFDHRVESAYNGYSSYRPAPVLGVDSTGSYWVPHPFGGLRGWDPNNLQEILFSCRTSLILHNPSATDDRDASRFLVANGGDYYAPSSVGSSTGGAYLYGIGTSRHRYVRAKWPNYQFHVMHTCTWNNLNASYPDIFS